MVQIATSSRLPTALRRGLVLVVLLAGACNTPPGSLATDGGRDGAVDQRAADQQVAPDAQPDQLAADSGPTLPKDLQPGWNVIYPGGDTVCSRGAPFMFAVNPGTVNKLVVDFEGGGACWTDLSCSISGALFKERAEDSLKYIQQGYAEGIYDRKNAQNPFKDWFHVFVPYCTGDIHWGDAVKTYGQGATAFDIKHKGAVNVRAVLKWIKERFSGPEKIFVTGCSAGSYGSLLWASHLIKQYPQAHVYQFGDSGAGVITQNFLSDSFPNWNALAATPSWIASLDPQQVDLLQKDMAYLYTSSANAQPQHVFTQYNTVADKTQVTYYQVMGGGTAAEWTSQMVSSIDTIIKGASTFRAFLAEGDKHCIIPYPELYTVEVDGTKLIDWLRDLVDDKPVSTLRCAACVPTP